MSRRLALLITAGYMALLVFVAATRGAVAELLTRHGSDGHFRQVGVGEIRFDGAGPEKWAQRVRKQARLIVTLRRRLARLHGSAAGFRAGGVDSAIRLVFGSYAGQALRVAWCESRLRTDARNGQYLGLFQMGSHERALYGDGSSALEQARAAYVYFVVSGRGWGPWSCKP